MHSRLIYELLLAAWCLVIFGTTPLYAQSSDLRSIIRDQSNIISTQTREIADLNQRLKKSQQAINDVRREAKTWRDSLKKIKISNANTDSLVRQIERQREELHVLSAQCKELDSLKVKNQELVRKLDLVKAKDIKSTYSFIGSKLSYLILSLVLLVIVFVLVRYRKILKQQVHSSFRQLRKLFVWRVKRAKTQNNRKYVPVQMVSANFDYALFAETIGSDGFFLRISVQQSDEKKYVLQVQANDANRAVIVLNYDSLYYTQWLQNAEQFLRRGVEVIRTPQANGEISQQEMFSGSAIRINGQWRIEKPIQLKFV